MNKLLLLVTFIIRVGSGIVMLMQGYEKLTGGFTLKGLVPVIANNTDSPEWYKWFFANFQTSTLIIGIEINFNKCDEALERKVLTLLKFEHK